jgi:hypothetical protein
MFAKQTYKCALREFEAFPLKAPPLANSLRSGRIVLRNYSLGLAFITLRAVIIFPQRFQN